MYECNSRQIYNLSDKSDEKIEYKKSNDQE